jgi:hypothetical protein
MISFAHLVVTSEIDVMNEFIVLPNSRINDNKKIPVNQNLENFELSTHKELVSW